MEKNANYALVGLSTLILTIGLVIFFAWLARISFSHDYDIYDVLFQGPVRGLNQGGEVHFNGIKVGEVTRIKLNEVNPTQVIARVRVDANVPIRQDSYGTLEPQGITGVNYIQISAGTPSKPLLKDITPRDQAPVIHTQRSALSDLIEGGGTVLSRTIEALDRVNKVLSDQNIKTFTTALNDTQAVTAEFRQRKAIFADAQKALQEADATLQTVDALATSGKQLMDGDGRRTMNNLADASESAKAAAADLRTMLNKLNGPTSEFAANGLPQITAAAIQLQQSAEAMERLANDIQSSPQSALGKPAAQEIKVKP
ncbi:MlaD family protein [Phenylobacterium sp.]|jgi:phospholipid/cholesterol/gamma-HCH transport system substrate-binding protein|uniref:MlaD family protein n=1 Tax=Phenylobacterium sp. TaxID=1871053 RepID=UPI002F427851